MGAASRRRGTPKAEILGRPASFSPSDPGPAGPARGPERAGRRGGTRAQAGHAERAPPSPDVDAETERAFREFREASVRLAERIADLRGVEPDPVASARQDLPMVRAIFGKWSSDVLVALHAVPSVGFEELRRTLPGISPRVLSLKLKELELGGMVHREVVDARPPRVRYTLTDRGWTVTWLAHPILLYLRTHASPSPQVPGDPARRDVGPPRRRGAGT